MEPIEKRTVEQPAIVCKGMGGIYKCSMRGDIAIKKWQLDQSFLENFPFMLTFFYHHLSICFPYSPLYIPVLHFLSLCVPHRLSKSSKSHICPSRPVRFSYTLSSTALPSFHFFSMAHKSVLPTPPLHTPPFLLPLPSFPTPSPTHVPQQLSLKQARYSAGEGKLPHPLPPPLSLPPVQRQQQKLVSQKL